MFPIEVWIGGAMLVALIVYALSGGANLGAGLWDLLATGPRKTRQRAAIAHAIAPIREVHQIWLLAALILMLACFPIAFSVLTSALYMPLALMLAGLVLRGAALAFRAHGIGGDTGHRYWGLIFGFASAFTPVMLGVVLGAVSSGHIRVDVAAQAVDTDFLEWLAPFPIAIGFLIVALFAFLSAVYLIHEVDDAALKADFRKRALYAGGAVFVMAWVSFYLAGDGAPVIRDGLWGRIWSAPFQGITGMMATGALSALLVGWYYSARILAMAHVALMILGWGLSMFPFVVVPDVTLYNAAAPESVLGNSLIALGIAMAIAIPSFWYLDAVFRVKKNEEMEGEGDEGSAGLVEVEEEDG